MNTILAYKGVQMISVILSYSIISVVETVESECQLIAGINIMTRLSCKGFMFVHL